MHTKLLHLAYKTVQPPSAPSAHFVCGFLASTEYALEYDTLPEATTPVFYRPLNWANRTMHTAILWKPFWMNCMLNMSWKSTERFGKVILKWKVCMNPDGTLFSNMLYLDVKQNFFFLLQIFEKHRNKAEMFSQCFLKFVNKLF